MTKSELIIEYRKILRLALPAIAGLSTQMIVSLVDTAMIGRLETATYALAAMGVGVLATWALISFFSSLATGTHVLVARNYGSGNYRKCGEVLNTSLVISILIGGIVASTGVFFSYQIADFFSKDPVVGILAGDYLHFRFMGIPFFLISVAYRGFFFGIGKTKIFMYSGILVNFLNIIFNYIFIFGAFGLKGMGLAGAGIGSTLATMCDVLFYISVALLSDYRKKYLYYNFFHFSRELAERIIRISLPVSFQNVFILIGFLIFVAITGIIGTLEQAVSQVIISALLFSMMPCFGFGIAVQTLVGTSYGSRDIKKAKFYGFKTSKIASAYTLLIGIIFIAVPQLILILITEDQQVIDAAVPALRIAGFGQVFYAIGVVLANSLQAVGESFFVMMSDIVANWIIFLPAAYLLGIVFDFGLLGAWAALPFYVIIYSLMMFLKFKYGSWQYKKGDSSS
ncbi:MAG: MATE family efflux transporter [Melioribacteraceae bacterium]|nr:MATE family efflux transporter [Melioribacteraceae bacterium]